MTVSMLADALGCEVLNFAEKDREIKGAYAGDLLSWVMGRAKPDNAWVTIMTNINVLAVASLLDLACVIVCESSDVESTVIEGAKSKGINLLKTSLPVYEACVKIGSLI